MSSTISPAEEKLFIFSKENSEKFLPICAALKLAGYDTAVISEIMRYVQAKIPVPERFSIVNNRYLACTDGLVYDLEQCKALTDVPEEPKRMAITFWI
jgi:hypothetical protein